MTNAFVSKVAAAAAGATLVSAVVSAPAQALNLQTASFSFTFPTSEPAPFGGQVGTGSFEVDFDSDSAGNPLNPGAPFQIFPFTQFQFTFLGTTYGIADNDNAGPGTGSFTFGQFLGLSLQNFGQVSPLPSDIGGWIFAESVFQALSPDFSVSSSTTVQFTPFTPSSAVIPTPALLPGLVGLGLSVWRKRSSQAA